MDFLHKELIARKTSGLPLAPVPELMHLKNNLKSLFRFLLNIMTHLRYVVLCNCMFSVLYVILIKGLFASPSVCIISK